MYLFIWIPVFICILTYVFSITLIYPYTYTYVGLVEYEKDFPPPLTEAPKMAAYLINSVLSDIAYGIGEISMRRNQRIQLNFQFRKPGV